MTVAPARPRAVLVLMSACVMLCVGLVAAVNLAVPQLAGAAGLRPTPTELLWIVDAYVIVFACLLIPAGALGDRLGRKGVLLAGLGVLAAGCAASALAGTPALLIAARALTGVGAALMMPATLSLALQSAAPGRAPQTVAVWTAATGAAGMVGNLGGGLALQYLPWQGLFWCAAPLALLLLALVARLAPRGERHPAHADPAGTALLVLGFVALLYGVIEGPERGWGAPVVLGAFAVAALVLAAFTGYALRAAHPLIDPRVFAARPLRAGVLGVAVTFFGLFGLFFVNAQYLQHVKGFSPALTGLAVGPLALGMLVVARRAVALVGRFGPRRVIGLGMGLLVAGLLALSAVDRGTPYAAYAGVLLVIAAGMGLAMPALSQAVVGALPAARSGLGSGLNSAAREVGSALGVAAMGTALAGHGIAAGADAAGIAAFTDGMSAGYRVAAAVVAAVTALVLLWLPGRSGAGAGPAPDTLPAPEAAHSEAAHSKAAAASLRVRATSAGS